MYGYAFTSPSYRAQPLEDFSVTSEGFNVLCAHSDIDSPVSEYAHITASQIESTGLDYIALGHIHTKDAIMKKGPTIYAYSGCIAGRDFSEYGEKGGILLTLSEVNGEKEVKAERVTFCPWIYKTENISIEGAVSQSEAAELIRNALSSDLTRKSGYEYITRLSLSGNIRFELDEELLISKLSELGVTEVLDNTYCLSELGELKNDYSIRGEFYRQIEPMLSSDDPKVRKRALKALHIGLSALSGAELNID